MDQAYNILLQAVADVKGFVSGVDTAVKSLSTLDAPIKALNTSIAGLTANLDKLTTTSKANSDATVQGQAKVQSSYTATNRVISDQVGILNSLYLAQSKVMEARFFSSIGGLQRGWRALKSEMSGVAIETKNGIKYLDEQTAAAERLALQLDMVAKTAERINTAWTAKGKQMQWTGRQMSMGITAPVLAVGGISIDEAIKQAAGVQMLQRLTNSLISTNGNIDINKQIPVVQQLLKLDTQLSQTWGQNKSDLEALSAEFAGLGGVMAQHAGDLTKWAAQFNAFTNLGNLKDAGTFIEQLANANVALGNGVKQTGTDLAFLSQEELKNQINMNQVVQSFPTLTALMETFHMNLGDVMGLLTTFKEQGLSIDEGATKFSTSMGRVMAALSGSGLGGAAAKAQRLQNVLKEVNAYEAQYKVHLNIFDSNGNLLPMDQVLGGLGELLNASQTNDQTRNKASINLSTALFGTRSYAEMDPVMQGIIKSATPGPNGQRSGFYGSVDTYNKTANPQTATAAQQQTVQQQFDQMLTAIQHNPQLQWEQLLQKFKNLGAAIGNDLLPVFLDLANKVDKVLNWFDQLDPHTRQLVEKIAGLVAAVGPLVYIFGQMNILGSTLTKALITKPFATIFKLRSRPAGESIGDSTVVQKLAEVSRKYNAGKITQTDLNRERNAIMEGSTLTASEKTKIEAETANTTAVEELTVALKENIAKSVGNNPAATYSERMAAQEAARGKSDSYEGPIEGQAGLFDTGNVPEDIKAQARANLASQGRLMVPAHSTIEAEQRARINNTLSGLRSGRKSADRELYGLSSDSDTKEQAIRLRQEAKDMADQKMASLLVQGDKTVKEVAPTIKTGMKEYVERLFTGLNQAAQASGLGFVPLTSTFLEARKQGYQSDIMPQEQRSQMEDTEYRRLLKEGRVKSVDLEPATRLQYKKQASQNVSQRLADEWNGLIQAQDRLGRYSYDTTGKIIAVNARGKVTAEASEKSLLPKLESYWKSLGLTPGGGSAMSGSFLRDIARKPPASMAAFKRRSGTIPKDFMDIVGMTAFGGFSPDDTRRAIQKRLEGTGMGTKHISDLMAEIGPQLDQEIARMAGMVYPGANSKYYQTLTRHLPMSEQRFAPSFIKNTRGRSSTSPMDIDQPGAEMMRAQADIEAESEAPDVGLDQLSKRLAAERKESEKEVKNIKQQLNNRLSQITKAELTVLQLRQKELEQYIAQSKAEEKKLNALKKTTHLTEDQTALSVEEQRLMSEQYLPMGQQELSSSAYDKHGNLISTSNKGIEKSSYPGASLSGSSSLGSTGELYSASGGGFRGPNRRERLGSHLKSRIFSEAKNPESLNIRQGAKLLLTGVDASAAEQKLGLLARTGRLLKAPLKLQAKAMMLPFQLAGDAKHGMGEAFRGTSYYKKVNESKLGMFAKSKMTALFPNAAAGGGEALSTILVTAAPLLPILLVIGGAIALIVTHWKDFSKTAGAALKDVKAAFKELISAVITPFKQVFADLGFGAKKGSSSIQGMAQTVKSALEGIADLLKFLAKMVAPFAKVFADAFGIIVEVVKAVIDLVTGKWSALGEDLKKISKFFVEGILTLLLMIPKTFLMGVDLILKGAEKIPIIGSHFKGAETAVKNLNTELGKAPTLIGNMIEANTKVAPTVDKKKSKDAGTNIAQNVQDGLDANPVTPDISGAPDNSGITDFISEFQNQLKKVVDDWKNAAMKQFDEYEKKQLQIIDNQTKALEEQQKIKDQEFENSKKQLTEEQKLIDDQNKSREHNATMFNDISEGKFSDARMEQLKFLGDTKLKNRQDQIDTLDQQKQAYDDQIQAQKDFLSEKKQNLQDQLDAQKTNLQEQLDAMTQFIPKNQAAATQMQTQILTTLKSFTGGYADAGQMNGAGWSESWATAMTNAKAAIDDKAYWTNAASQAATLFGAAFVNSLTSQLGGNPAVPAAPAPGGPVGPPSASAGPTYQFRGQTLNSDQLNSLLNQNTGSQFVNSAIPGNTSSGPSIRAVPHHTGGLVAPFKFHSGGEVPALLLPGEYVLRKEAVKKIGIGALNMLNNVHRLTAPNSLTQGMNVPNASQMHIDNSKTEIHLNIGSFLGGKSELDKLGEYFYNVVIPKLERARGLESRNIRGYNS